MSQFEGLTDAELRTPRAAAVAGVIFSLLTLTSFGLLWGAIPTDPQASGGWLAANTSEIALALNLIPFAGVAFLWFVGVIRDRLGQREDRFFATVFLGSGLLFLGMLFVAAAVVGAMLVAFKDDPAAFASSAFRLARAISYNLVNVYMVRMAGVFMISTSTVAMATHFAPRWQRAGISAGGLAPAWQSFPALEFRAVSALGPAVQHPNPGEQFWPKPEGLKIGRRRVNLVTLRLAAHPHESALKGFLSVPAPALASQ